MNSDHCAWCSAVIPAELILSTSMSALTRLSSLTTASVSSSLTHSWNTTSSGNLTRFWLGCCLAAKLAFRDIVQSLYDLFTEERTARSILYCTLSQTHILHCSLFWLNCSTGLSPSYYQLMMITSVMRYSHMDKSGNFSTFYMGLNVLVYISVRHLSHHNSVCLNCLMSPCWCGHILWQNHGNLGQFCKKLNNIWADAKKNACISNTPAMIKIYLHKK